MRVLQTEDQTATVPTVTKRERYMITMSLFSFLTVRADAWWEKICQNCHIVDKSEECDSHIQLVGDVSINNSGLVNLYTVILTEI